MISSRLHAHWLGRTIGIAIGAYYQNSIVNGVYTAAYQTCHSYAQALPCEEPIRPALCSFKDNYSAMFV